MSAHVTDHAAAAAANARFWATWKAPEEYRPANALEAAAHRQAEAFARGITSVADREQAPERTGMDLTTLPASCDISPELAANYAHKARVRIGEARSAEPDDELESEIAAQRDRDADKHLAEIASVVMQRESGYIRHLRNRAGEIISAEAYERSYEGRAQLDEDSIDIMLRLEAAGRPAFGSGPQAWIVDPVSGQSKALINSRKRAIIPSAAAEKRAPVLAALELLMHQKEFRFAKFCTFTHGPRVPLRPSTSGAEVRTAAQEMHRKLSKLNAEPFMKEAGVRLLFRSTEIGSFEEWVLAETGKTVDILEPARAGKDGKKTMTIRERGRGGRVLSVESTALRSRFHKNEAGEWTLHLHAHVLLHWPRYFTDAERDVILAKIWDFWGAHWSIDGALEKVREACKYMLKPADYKLLNGPEIAALDAAFFKLRRVTPLWELKEQISYRRDHCLVVKRERRMMRNDGGERSRELVPVVVPDWNAWTKSRLKTPEQRKAEKRRKQNRERLRKVRVAAEKAAIAAAFSAVGEPTRQAEVLRFDAEHRREVVLAIEPKKTEMARPPKRSAPLGPRPAWQNRVVARLSPAPYFDRVATPGLLVWSDQRPDIEAIRALPVVRQIIDAVGAQVSKARAMVAAGGPSVRSVHTNPVTVREFGPPKQRTGYLPALMKPSGWQNFESEQLTNV